MQKFGAVLQCHAHAGACLIQLLPQGWLLGMRDGWWLLDNSCIACTQAGMKMSPWPPLAECSNLPEARAESSNLSETVARRIGPCACKLQVGCHDKSKS